MTTAGPPRRAGGWWDGFYSDRGKPIPFFANRPDENLVGYLDRGLIRPRRVLELGCGPGRNAVFLAGAGAGAGARVDAVDLSPAAIAWARERAAQAGLGAAEVRFHRGDAFELTREELLGPYDLVYDSGCFHHLPPHTPESRRATPIATAAADMRSLPFAAERFDVVLSADNSVAHLLTDEDLRNALRSLRYALRPDGLLVITLRDYEEARASHPCSTAPQVTLTPTGRVITFQRWHWQPDGERYELEHFQVFQLLPDGDTRVAETTSVRGRHATCRALTRGQLRAFAEAAGFADVRWLEPAESGFFQPVLTARAAAPAA